MHLTADLLWNVYTGDAPPDRLVSLLEQHDTDECSECQDAWFAFQARCNSIDYDNVIDSVLGSGQLHHASRYQNLAQGWFDELRQLPAHHQVDHVANHNDGFRGEAFAHLCLQEARQKMPGDPESAERYAKIAEIALCCSDPEVLALALAHQANARRAAGDLMGAERLHQESRKVAPRQADLAIAAEITGFLGSLRMDQRRFDEAHQHLSRAIRLCRMLGDTRSSVIHSISLGYNHYFSGQLDQAIQVTEDALAEVDSLQQSRLYLCGRHNLTLYLWASGRGEEAETTLQEDLPLYRRHADSWPRLPCLLDWLAGRIALLQERYDEAEMLLRRTRERCVMDGVDYDATLAGLDLAALYTRQGRYCELQALTAELIPVLRSYQLHHEARAALYLFETALRQQALSLETVYHLSTRLEQARWLARTVTKPS